MAFDLNSIDTIIVALMENRSFDQMLGSLTLPPHNRTDLEGLHPGLSNSYMNRTYPIRSLVNPELHSPNDNDPLHERADVGDQLGVPAGGVFPMDGFAANYIKTYSDGVDNPESMGYWDIAKLPMYKLFAEQYALCDHWFAPVPTGTQPNRLMAYSGYTLLDKNSRTTLPDQHIMLDWLTEQKVRFRCYHEDISFLFLMIRGFLSVTFHYNKHFKSFVDNFETDYLTMPDAKYPQVIYIEPSYASNPFPSTAYNDDHPPTPVARGQDFLNSVYTTLLKRPDRFARTLLLVTYDEHGGYYDHVSPPWVRTLPPPGLGAHYTPFESLGPRVPAFLVNPGIKPGSVFSGILDHTAILKLFGERFAPDKQYSPVVNARPIGSLAAALDQVAMPVAPAVAVESVRSLVALRTAPPRSKIRSIKPLLRLAAHGKYEDPNSTAFAFVLRKQFQKRPAQAKAAFPHIKASALKLPVAPDVPTVRKAKAPMAKTKKIRRS